MVIHAAGLAHVIPKTQDEKQSFYNVNVKGTQYRYSNALRQSGILWNATTLDAWLANPKKFVPGNRMRFSGIRNDRARAALIAFLETATSEKP